MDVADYIGFVASEGTSFASAAERGDLSAEIQGCPGWDLRELVRHLGLIHLWAAASVAFPKSDWHEVDELDDLIPCWPDLAAAWPDDAALVDWYRATHGNLVHTLRAAPADVPAFTFLPAPTPLTMWARRQASEIAIHRFDAEQACGITTSYDPLFATDMLDELMSGFAPRTRATDMDQPKVLHVHATDTDEHWFTTIGPELTETARQGSGGDLTLTGRAADLYVRLWNRTPEATLTTSGDTELMDLWYDTVNVRWS